MRAYVVVGESGEYSDWSTWIEGVHSTERGAVDHIERLTFERAIDLDGGGELMPWDYSQPRAVCLFCHPVRMGNAWVEPPSAMGDEAAYHVEEWEVQEP